MKRITGHITERNNKWYGVINLYDADGKRRPLENPKCKNPRHVQWLEIELEPKAMTTNRALRRALREAEQASRTV